MGKRNKPVKRARGRGELTHVQRREVMEASVRKVFASKGYGALTRAAVSADAGVSATMANVHFGTADAMRAWAIEDAIKRKDVDVFKAMVRNEGYELPDMPRSLRALCLAA